MKLTATARIVHTIAGAVLALLGVAHVGFTPMAYPLPSFGALWFAGTGLMTLFAGVLNLLAARSRPDPALLRVAFFLDLLGTAYTFEVTRMLRQPQAWVGLAAFALATLCALVRAARAPRRSA